MPWPQAMEGWTRNRLKCLARGFFTMPYRDIASDTTVDVPDTAAIGSNGNDTA